MSDTARLLKQTKPPGFPRRTDWSLVFGAGLVGLVLLLAVFGPLISPHDPLQENYIFKTATGFKTPPLPAFQLSAFPLGSDEFGRDVLSRLLWGVQPTMTLVLVVVAIRLILGTGIGLLAGWSEGRIRRGIDQMISTTVALPVIFVALCAIAAFGQRLGIWAFIIGLSLTGWAESARIIGEQARLVKQKQYIEAAVALGASGRHNIFRHVLPYILPLMWTTLAFEVSSTLLTTAGLGFLGYFTNSIWVAVGDYTGLRTSGQPELGEMLAGSLKGFQNQPWTVLAAGGLIFLTVLGFNLLGNGLRNYFSPELSGRRKGKFESVVGEAGAWLEDRWSAPRYRSIQSAAVGVTLVFILAAGIYTLSGTQKAVQWTNVIQIPGGHMWPAVHHDAQSTYWTDAAGPSAPVILWTYAVPEAINGGPVVAADGTLYLSIAPDSIHALDPDGKLLWSVTLVDAPIGSPAIGPDGVIFANTSTGGLAAVSPEGKALWQFVGDDAQPLASPVVGMDGTIYYSTEKHLFAVSAQGEMVWKTLPPTYSFSNPQPRLSPDGKYLFFENSILNAHTGGVIVQDTPGAIDRFLIGTDGRYYLNTRNALNRLTFTPEGLTMETAMKWNQTALNLSFRYAVEGGITPHGRVWLLFSSTFDYFRLIWLDFEDTIYTPLDYPYQYSGYLVGIDRNDISYVCGSNRSTNGSQASCRANHVGDTAPIWKIELEKGGFMVGGAVIPGRIYISTGEGTLYSIGDPPR